MVGARPPNDSEGTTTLAALVRKWDLPNRSNAPTETLIKGTQRKKLTELNTLTLGNLIKRNHDGFPGCWPTT